MSASALEIGDRVRLKDAVEFTCPFCGQPCHHGTAPDGSYDMVVHKMPICQTFEKLEPLEFVRACVKEAKKRAAN